MRSLKAPALLLACAIAACSDNRAPQVSQPPAVANSVSAFLERAERQSETDDQRREIQRALRDTLEKPEEELRAMRYSDYSGRANAWSVTELLTHYFVPNPPAALDQDRFFQDVRAPEARAAIQHQLDEITSSLR